MIIKAYTQEDLNKTLWSAADSSRSSVDAGIYKDYALTILFFKYVSDLNKKRYAELKERFGDDEKRIQEKLKLDRFYLPPKASFDYVYSKIEEDNLGEEINKALHLIEDANKEKLEGVFHVDFNSESVLGKAEQRNKMLRHLIGDFAKIDLSN
ncbi:MAG: type I restriction-modification system subunit M N-terminal domain-containing protein, partial [Candidatus Magasanikbacteria bacterium]|nr:type I restriction-modification system subunit M N-terminal domain-containing protein [Candidatus Magasanikbacteria bacterium]